jgi:uncharacterized membrane protein
MGFDLIVLAIALAVFVFGLYLDESNYTNNETLMGFLAVGWVISIIVAVISTIALLLIGIDFLSSGVTLQKLENSRSTYTRMLNEDYNADNLNTALAFNNRMKLSNYKNSTFLWKYNDDLVTVDTIVIPKEKFTPKQIIKLQTTDSLGQ